MADFRKWILALAVVALFTGFASTASAQLITCNGSVPVPTVVRGEGYAEQAGDIVLQCSGGAHTTPGQQVATANISVFVLGVNLTSKLTNPSGLNGTSSFSEALLMINEPTPASQLICNQGGNSTGTAANGQPDGFTAGNGNGAGVCSITSPSASAFTYDGTSNGYNTGSAVANTTCGAGGGAPAANSYGCGRPNVFHGQQVGSNQITFGGVPIDSACATGAQTTCANFTTLRITNIRIDAESLQLASVNQLTSVNAQLAITGNSTITLANNVVTGIATVQLGLAASKIVADKGFLQCVDNKGILETNSGSSAFSAGMSITLAENFRSSWKAQNLAGICANDQVVSGCTTNGNPPTQPGFYLYSSTAPNTVPTPVAQNLPGVSYNSETGFYVPALSDGYGSQTAGLATQGTRLYVKVTSVPGGVNVWYPVKVNILNSNGTVSGVAILVNTDTAGGGNYSPVTGTNIVSGSIAANTYGQVTVDSSGNAFAVYEVVFADPNSSESVKIIPAISYTSNLTSTPQTPTPNVLTSTGITGFAPFYATVNASTNIPRFIPGGPPTTGDLFLISKCACNLLFPWIVSDGSYTSAIEVSNTSLDPGITFGFLATKQAGTVAFFRFGQTGTTPVTAGTPVADNTGTATFVSPSVPAGQFATWIVPTGFAGYVIAQASFQYCHGLAFLFSTQTGVPPLNYLGLILDKGSVLSRTTQSTREEDAF